MGAARGAQGHAAQTGAGARAPRSAATRPLGGRWAGWGEGMTVEVQILLTALAAPIVGGFLLWLLRR
jgi:hypothetical protein